MKKPSVNPLYQSLDFWLEQLPFSHNFKQWLKPLFNKESLSDWEFFSLEEWFHFLQNRSEHLQKLLFLYGNPEETPFFDAEALDREKTKTISNLFQNRNGVFHGDAIEILDQVKKHAAANKTFREEYARTKRNNKKNFSIQKRMEIYLNGKYPFELIAEFEEIPVSMLKRDLLPFLLWGVNVYTAIHELKYGEPEEKNCAGIPRWKDGNKAFLPFLGYAAKTKNLDVPEKIFKEVNLCETINILVDIFHGWNYRENWLASAVTDDFDKENQNGCELRDYIETENPDEKERAWLFLEFIGGKINDDTSGGSLAAIQSFFPNLCNLPAGQSPAGYLDYLSGTANKKTFGKFIKTMAKKAASFPVNDFLDCFAKGTYPAPWGEKKGMYPESNTLPKQHTQEPAHRFAGEACGGVVDSGCFNNYSGGGISAYVTDFLREYLKNIKPGNDETILIGRYLYNVIDNQGGRMPGRAENILYMCGFWNICERYMDNTGFVLRLLAVPGSFSGEHYSKYDWIEQVFITWFSEKHAAAENDPVWSHYDAEGVSGKTVSVIETLLSAGTIYCEPDITEYIWDLTKEQDEANHIKNIFLFAGYFARTNKKPERDVSLLNTGNLDAGVKNELNVMMYLKNHGKFDLVDFSLNHASIRDIETFPEIVFALNKTNFAELALLFLKENGKSFAEVREICRITGRYPLFLKDLASVPSASPESYFEFFADRVLNENEGEFAGLFTFLEVYSFSRGKINSWLEKQAPKAAKIIDRCKKHLALLRKGGSLDINPEEKKYFTATAYPAACLVSETGDYWKGVKPLLLAFRKSREVLLNEKLYPLNPARENIADCICRLLSGRGNDAKSRKLRQDMANEFCDYLKPLPAGDGGDREDRRNNYSEIEQNFEGFDLSCREPNPEWRYAYIRAIADLGVDTDGKGHLFHFVLNKVAENDPSENVRDAAIRAAKQLRQIRGGWKKGSDCRMLLQAFWWLRRAHMTSLQTRFDEKEALKTRINEFRRTAEEHE
jgi:hypothetical protein